MSDVSGKSLVDLLAAQLDQFVDSFQEVARDHGPDDSTVCKERGKAHGCAVALAFVLNPYAPDTAGVKAAALARWQDRQPDEDESTASTRRVARRAARQARRAARNK